MDIMTTVVLIFMGVLVGIMIGKLLTDLSRDYKLSKLADEGDPIYLNNDKYYMVHHKKYWDLVDATTRSEMLENELNRYKELSKIGWLQILRKLLF